jgi:hypothetical protein
MTTIEAKLKQLEDMLAHIDVINMHYQRLRAALIPYEVQEELKAIDAEQKTTLDSMTQGIEQLKAQIKEEVIKKGETVKGEHLMAVYSKGKVTWNNKGLEDYAIAHPEVLDFRKIGEPSVAIKTV